MSTVIEEATIGLREARESLRKAEEELRNCRNINPTDFTSADYLTFSAKVTACKAVLAGAQQALQTLQAENSGDLVGSKAEQPQPRNKRPSSTRKSSSTLRRKAASDNDHDSVPIQEDTGSPVESNFTLEDFKIKSILGCGRTKVYYDAKNELALKGIDLWKQSHMLPELKNEVEIYRLLSDLQGRIIPKLVLHGYWEGGMYLIGFSLCGTVPKGLSKLQKQSVLSGLDAIHKRGIMHNDIRNENILVDKNGKVYLIDFGFATINSDENAQQDERAMMVLNLETL